MSKGFITTVMLFCSLGAITCLAQTADSKQLNNYSGSYSLGRNEFIWIVVDGGSLIFGESVSGRGGRLVPVSEKKFVAGPALGVDSPVAARR